jgi:HAD superfamily hydrolase (TIGR01549 family)
MQMTQKPGSEPLDWDATKLVVFDVDGTLYRQSSLRLRMAREMLVHAAAKRSWRHVSVLSAYRRIREELGDQETDQFDAVLLDRTAKACRVSPNLVHTVIAEWIETRPLRHLAGSRYARLVHLFDALHRHGKQIGIYSDYPAAAKLEALGLKADHVVCASDPHIGILKPNPRGLQKMMREAQVTPQETLLIGDRVERDGLAAQRAGTACLIRSEKPREGWRTFSRFDDPVFAPLLQR